MKGNKLWIVVALLIAAVIAIVIIQGRKQESAQKTDRSKNEALTQTRSLSTMPPTNADSRQVPAYYEVPPAAAELPPVVAPSRFAGKAREAYEAVKQIPVTIAQLPCYCHCDRGMGHKSLHSCFEDDHASHCAICVDEALMAYRLQKEGLSAGQIRKQIIAEFAD
jgi:hypothetical protein